ncbi:MAG: hypothetical protein AAF902_17535 [Chloroflexota bacterium]
MKFDFDQGLPVWVWGILFFLVVLPFSFRSGQPNQTFGPVDLQESEAVPTIQSAQVEPTAVIAPAVETVDAYAGPAVNVTVEILPPPTINPDATAPVIIEVPRATETPEGGGYPEPEVADPEGYE